MEDMGYFSNMVECKGNSANQIGLPDSATGLKKEMIVVTSLKMGVGTDFATYYIVEHYIVEAEKEEVGSGNIPDCLGYHWQRWLIKYIDSGSSSASLYITFNPGSEGQLSVR